VTDFPLKTLGVAGAGRMGSGIAQICAAAGFKVVLFDADAGALARGRAAIERGLETAASKGLLTAGAQAAAAARIAPAGAIEALAGCDGVIEAISEKAELKIELFARLDAIARGARLLASNTSSISLTRLAAATTRPDRVIGLHFMNPVPVMTLVEVVRALQTSEATYALARALAERLGKTVVVSQDRPGFIVNRILIPMINEAAFALMEGVATAEAIDLAMRLGTNQPMGPLALADLIGLDVCLDIAEVLQRELGEDKYRPCPLLRKYVEAGRLGKKTGMGFYKY
jgi:3-hydroxybutyryl-CoA dehydrogenase